jgi:precorrin-3B synthase
MTARAVLSSHRRGACPGLSAPMPTGDGLLVRFMPLGTIPLEAFTALCAAARRHGNGIIEVTARGSIQIRGLSPHSAAVFADAVAALDIAAAEGIAVHANPLAGLDPAEILDAATLAADMRRALAGGVLATKLAHKISVAVDGGGALGIGTLTADIRLDARLSDGVVMLGVSIGGDAASAVQLGSVAPADGSEAALRLLAVIASHGRDVRARDILAANGAAPFRAAIADLLPGEASPPDGRECSESIGTHRLRDDTAACGVALAFGHTDTVSLQGLADAAKVAGAAGFRTANGRALIAVGLSRKTAPTFVAAAARFGFIVRADDPRRRVIACAGAPICASAHIAARSLAPRIAEIARPNDGAPAVHISGCAKGCAHAGAAALTVVGTPAGCALIADGSVRDAPFTTVAVAELPEAIARYAREPKREHDHV